MWTIRWRVLVIRGSNSWSCWTATCVHASLVTLTWPLIHSVSTSPSAVSLWWKSNSFCPSTNTRNRLCSHWISICSRDETERQRLISFRHETRKKEQTVNKDGRHVSTSSHCTIKCLRYQHCHLVVRTTFRVRIRAAVVSKSRPLTRSGQSQLSIMFLYQSDQKHVREIRTTWNDRNHLWRTSMTYTAASHQGAIETLWLHFSGAVMSSIFIDCVLWCGSGAGTLNGCSLMKGKKGTDLSTSPQDPDTHARRRTCRSGNRTQSSRATSGGGSLDVPRPHVRAT